MNIFEKLRLLTEYAPLIGYAQRLVSEQDHHAKLVIVAEAAEWITNRTEIEWDDELVEHVADILRSEEGEALVRWVLSQLEVRPDDE